MISPILSERSSGFFLINRFKKGSHKADLKFSIDTSPAPWGQGEPSHLRQEKGICSESQWRDLLLQRIKSYFSRRCTLRNPYPGIPMSRPPKVDTPVFPVAGENRTWLQRHWKVVLPVLLTVITGIQLIPPLMDLILTGTAIRAVLPVACGVLAILAWGLFLQGRYPYPPDP